MTITKKLIRNTLRISIFKYCININARNRRKKIIVEEILTAFFTPNTLIGNRSDFPAARSSFSPLISFHKYLAWYMKKSKNNQQKNPFNRREDISIICTFIHVPIIKPMTINKDF